jgi:hypothetical protein
MSRRLQVLQRLISVATAQATRQTHDAAREQRATKP